MLITVTPNMLNANDQCVDRYCYDNYHNRTSS